MTSRLGIAGQWCCRSEPPGLGGTTGSGRLLLRGQGTLVCLEELALDSHRRMHSTQHLKELSPALSFNVYRPRETQTRLTGAEPPTQLVRQPRHRPVRGRGPARACRGDCTHGSGAGPLASTATACEAAVSRL